VQGRFCQNCGQENVLTKQSFFSLATHFIYDILHFDSKFFDTLKYVLFRPGFIPKRYISGQRMRFLDPIRMYLFTSALFFLVFFSLKSSETSLFNYDEPEVALTGKKRAQVIEDLQHGLEDEPADTALKNMLLRLLDSTQRVTTDELKPFSRDRFIGLTDKKIQTFAGYDSMQKTLPPARRDNWFERMMIKRSLEIDKKYSGNVKAGVTEFSDLFMHKLPYLLFLSLPFFALILKLLYIRRKTFFYSDHAVFTLYHYIFSFILLLIGFLCTKLENWSHFKLFQIPIYLFLLAWPVYLFISMRRFYGQSRLKTFGKFLLLNVLGCVILLLLFVIFVFFTIFQL